MEPKGLRTGHIVALAGALVVLLSLFVPWYDVQIPDALRQMLGAGGQIGSDPGLLGAMSRGIAQSLPSSISASGWTELEGADIALCVLAVGTLAAVVAAAGAFGAAIRVDPRAAGSVIAAAGGAGLVLAIVHVFHKPGAGTPLADAVTLRAGVWLAFGGSAAMAIGGLLAAREERAPAPAGSSASSTGFARLEPELPPVFAEASASVPPPRG